MSDQQKQPPPLFGVSLAPVAHEAEKLLHLSQVAEASGLDLLAIQDHPYNPTFLDTWTLLALIGGQTRQIRLMAGVSPIALRPPAMLAKAAASLDVLTGGRVEMGLGTGAFWDAIESFGGPRRKPGEAVAALREGIEIMRLLWQDPAGSAGRDGASRAVSYNGQYYSLKGAQAGPAPRHNINIWVGAVGPKMLQLVGELADGWFAPLAVYVSPEQAAASNKIIDAAAVAAGRDPGSVRRIYVPLLAHLRSRYQGREEVEQRLLALLAHLRERADYAQGDGPANLLALLREQRGHLRGLDLSQLALRGVYLQGVEMQDANLSRALMKGDQEEQL